MRRAVRLSVLYLLEAFAALLALAIFAGAALLWRLASGPLDASGLEPAAVSMLADAFGADTAALGGLEARFDPGEATITVSARDLLVQSETGATLARARRVEAAFALDALLIGRAAPVRVSADGGAFAVVRRADGSIGAGFGRAERLLAASRDAGSGDGAGMRRLRDALAEVREEGALSRLSEIDVRGVQLRVLDEASGLDWIFTDVRAAARFADGAVETDFSGALLTSAGLAPVALNLRADRALEEVFLDMRVSELVPAAAAPRRGPGAHLGRIDAPVSAELVLDASQSEGLRAALLELDAGQGTLRIGAGRTASLEAAGLRLAFDTRDGEIRMERAEVRSDAASLQASGRLYDFSRFANALPGRARFEIDAGPGFFSLPSLFEGPREWSRLSADGALRPFDLAAEIEALTFAFSGLELEAQGEAGLAPTPEGLRPQLSVEAVVRGQPVKSDVLGWWPPGFADGAREWVASSILDGRLNDVRLRADVPADVLAGAPFTEDMLDLTFRFEDADVLYMQTMTPLEGVSGEARLRGAGLMLSGGGGMIGSIQVDEIFVEAPKLERGAVMRFGGAARTGLPALIALLEEPPLELPSRYGVQPGVFDGDGRVTFEISRPLRSTVPPEELGYAFTGVFAGVEGPTGLGPLRFEDGAIDVAADPSGLEALGVARIAGANARLSWTETFGLDPGSATTGIAIEALVDARALDRMGLPLRRFLDGAVGLEARLNGRGFDFETVEAAFDLENAAVVAPNDLWSKPSGEPARASVSFRVLPDGGADLRRIRAEAPGARLDASARLDAAGRLLEAQVSDVFVDGLMDLSGSASRPQGPDGPLRLELSGGYLDAEPFLDEARRSGLGGDGASGALVLDARLDVLGVRGAEMRDAQLALAVGESGLERLRFEAAGPRGRTRAEVAAPDVDAPRNVVMRSPDAGLVLSALTGYGNAEGGVLVLDAQAPPAGGDGALAGALSVTGFRLDQMPLLARVLAAGSLQGLADLLGGGEGISFETLEAEFRWSDGVLEMRSARAAGPSLGATWEGVVDFAQARVAVDGTLLPSYGVNSAASGLPVLGDILTSRPGEGVIGLTFSAEGPFTSTRVFANPLSALAPGVFRRIFEGTSAAREFEALESRRRAAEGLPPVETPPSGATPPQDDEGGRRR